MSRLEEIHTQLSEMQLELEEEGVSVVSYWFARCNIEKDEYMELLDTIIETIVTEADFPELTAKEKLRILVTYGFIFGVVYGREKQENEF